MQALAAQPRLGRTQFAHGRSEACLVLLGREIVPVQAASRRAGDPDQFFELGGFASRQVDVEAHWSVGAPRSAQLCEPAYDRAGGVAVQ